MALERKDSVQDTTTSTGTGTINLTADAINGYNSFVNSFTSGATVRYRIQTADESEWEVGEGVFTDGTPDTLTRVTVYASSNAGSLVDFSAGNKQVFGVLTAGDLEPQETGWVPVKDAWTYSSVDDPTGVITVPSDATTKYSVGMRIKFTNATNTIYGIITAVTSTSITFLHEIDPTDSLALHLMQNSAITNIYYSTQNPFGFPTEIVKWTVIHKNISNESETTITSGTWYNVGTVKLDLPIGVWDVIYLVNTQYTTANASIFTTLSDANNTESDSDMTAVTSNATGLNVHNREKQFSLTSKTSKYLNVKTTGSGGGDFSYRGDLGTTIIRAVCAYL